MKRTFTFRRGRKASNNIPPGYIRLFKSKNNDLNMKFYNIPFWRRYKDFFNALLDAPFYLLLIGAFLVFAVIHFCFGVIYFIGGPKGIDNVPEDDTIMFFLDCIFFSIQTMSTIGYGKFSPLTVYTNSIVGIQIFFGYFYEMIFLTVILSKLSRPTTMENFVMFSRKAVAYENSKGKVVLKIRCSNIRHASRPAIGAGIKLVLIVYDPNEPERYKMHDLGFTINGDMDEPLLPIPFEIKHEINDDSPLNRYLNASKRMSGWKHNVLEQVHFEIIAIYNATDSLTSNSYEAIKSYTPFDVVFDKKFKKWITYSDKQKTFLFDYEDLDIISEERVMSNEVSQLKDTLNMQL